MILGLSGEIRAHAVAPWSTSRWRENPVKLSGVIVSLGRSEEFQSQPASRVIALNDINCGWWKLNLALGAMS